MAVEIRASVLQVSGTRILSMVEKVGCKLAGLSSFHELVVPNNKTFLQNIEVSSVVYLSFRLSFGIAGANEDA